ncbi:LysR family hydrogen peroxide-inducible transcriptional activator [Rhodovulum iodosum]|uniref:LysR family hydrogen peroxide-inducible transcriptional activator n=1 Tax=Rhodovulum iodosum TaxID=68291 RepID=A0ABV3XUD3_9RHOB|nr:hydrogen peroxide-inducible genes activator [Rhodovulum robiginosum]RSK32124.1 hydrogen peroxide-inducible genes activator [Rhodovulum robiginosum]
MDQDPTLKQLKYFAALSEAGHYRKAAERVGISQPSLSLQIATLETRLGLILVERGRAGAVLTPAGREVLARVGRILDDVASLNDLSARLKTGMAGALRLGSSPTLGPYILPKVVRRLHARYPSLRLYIHDAAPRRLLEDLLAGKHDLILTHLPVNSSDVTVERLFREPLKVAVARGHPFAGQAAVRDEELSGQTVLSLSSAFTLHDQIIGLCHELGATLRQDYEGTSLDALRQMTAMDMGLTFLPALYVQSEVTNRGDDVEILSFRRDRFARSIGLVWRASSADDASFRRFASVIREVAEEDFPGLVSTER